MRERTVHQLLAIKPRGNEGVCLVSCTGKLEIEREREKDKFDVLGEHC